MNVPQDIPYRIILRADCKKPLHAVPEGVEVEVNEAEVTIKFPKEIIKDGISPPELIGLLWEMSRDEEGRPCDIKEVIVNVNRRSGFKGKSALRRLIGRGPLLAVTVAKGMFLDPRGHAKVFSNMVEHGLDIGIDPLNSPEDDLYERAYHIEEEIDHYKDEGRKALYVYTAPSDLEIADKVISLGAKAFRIDALTNLVCFNRLADRKVFLFLTRPFLLPRLRLNSYRALIPFGFEVIERPSASLSVKTDWIDDLIRSTDSIPMTSPDVTPRNLDYNMSNLDVVIWGDTSAYAHPGGAIAGVKALREMIDSYLRGENLLSVARRVEEVEKAVEKWGLEFR